VTVLVPEATRLDIAGVATALIDVAPAVPETGPPVLLLHGSGPGVTAAANWRPVIPALSQDRRVLAPDQLGFGGTATGEPRTYGRAAWTAHGLALLDSLGVGPVDIIGNSMGGAVALSIAHARPRAVRRIVLMGSMGVAMALPPGLNTVWGYTPGVPIVTGDLDVGVLDELVRLCAHLDRLRRDGISEQGGPGPSLREVLEQQVIGKAVALLSGPGGLASFLRRRQFGSRLGGRSLPLDVGVSSDIPVAIRRAVIERDQHCQFPNGCDQPASGCEVHHLTHRADGGKTSVKDCMLFCTHHHQVEIHRNGWTVVLNPDGTTTAWNKDKTKVLHSHSHSHTRNHSPPPRPG
jgi:pimeloyl-ACP methyl ester carboxylesterase